MCSVGTITTIDVVLLLLYTFDIAINIDESWQLIA